MKKWFYLRIIVLLTATVFVFVTGCAKKETVKESGEGMKQAGQEEIKAQSENKPMQENVSPLKEMNVPEKEQKEIVPEKNESTMKEKTQLADIYFDFDKYNLRSEDRKILSGHADWLLKNSEYKIKIEGNCDERGTEEYNMALGQRRADEAKQYLINMGIDKKRFSTISYGKDRPVDPGHNESAWAKNRNDHFVLNK